MQMWYDVLSFIDKGGDVLYILAIVALIMWTLILEKVWYLFTDHKSELARVKGLWDARAETRSWHAHQIRRMYISEVGSGLSSGLTVLQACVGLCTLIGLLGTVAGMVTVFDTMATQGNSNARMMAAGVSKATIPTMAGMVAALSGLYFSAYLQNKAKTETQELADELTQH
jgi:biopolymer transport protein ExbB